MTGPPAEMYSLDPSATSPATVARNDPRAAACAEEKLGDKKVHWVQASAPTARMVFSVATASSARAGRLPAAPTGGKQSRKPTAAASALAEAAAKKKMKKTAAAPRPKPTPRAATPAPPTATAPARVAAAVGNKNRGRQVLDEMPTR